MTRDELVGTWLAGPDRRCGVGKVACGSRFQLGEDGRFTVEAWGLAGPDGGIDVEQGRWRLEGDRVICEQHPMPLVSRIAWVGADRLILQPAERELGDGTYGTHYVRQKLPR